MKSIYPLGAGRFRVLLEITRPDGKIDTVEVHQLWIPDSDGATLTVTEEDEEIIDSRFMRVQMSTPPKTTLRLELEGEPLRRETDGMFMHFTLGGALRGKEDGE